MKITFFFRNPKVGISIGKVFNTILGKFPNAISFTVPSHRSLPWSLVRNLIYIHRHRDNEGINHITGDIHYGVFALRGCKSVLTIHDMILMENKTGLSRIIKGWLWYKLPVKYASYVTYISNHTKTEFEKYYGKELPNSRVIYNPVDEIYKPSKKPFNTERPVILHVGTRLNKNLSRVIESLKDIPCELRIIGTPNDTYISQLENTSIDYKFLSNISEEQLEKEYSNCDIVSFPSTYEGFGMPIIEGQAEGKIIVTSDLPPMNEIAGDGAILVNPYEISSIRDGFLKAIKDANIRNDVVEAGLDNVKRFKPDVIAAEYQKVYDIVNGQ